MVRTLFFVLVLATLGCKVSSTYKVEINKQTVPYAQPRPWVPDPNDKDTPWRN